MKQNTPKLALTIKVRGDNCESFISRYFRDVAPGGFFLRAGTTELPALGTLLRFCFHLEDGLVLLAGRGTVTYVQRNAEHRGVGIRFEHIQIGRDVHAKMLSLKTQHREHLEEFHAVATRPIPRVEPAVRLSQS